MTHQTAYRDRLTLITSGAGVATLLSKPIKPNQKLVLMLITWSIDKSLGGGNYRAQLYVDGHGYKHFLKGQIAPTKGAQWTHSQEVHITPGERLALELDEAAAATVVEVYLSGYMLTWDKEVA